MPDVTGGVLDLWEYLKIDRPHRIPIMALSIVLPVMILYLFLYYLTPVEEVGPDIIYFENWTLERSDDETRCDWLARAQERNEYNAKVRKNYQAFADSLGIEYDAQKAEAETQETREAQIDGIDCSQVEDSSMPTALDLAE